MNKRIWLIVSIFSLFGAAVGVYFAETVYHTIEFVYWAVIAPLAISGFSFCMFMEKVYKK